MSRKVEIEMTVEDAKAVRAWQRAKDNIAEFDKQGQKTSKTFGTMVSDQVKGIAATAAGFAGVGSVIGGIVTAANLLRAEYDNLLQRQSKAANIQLPLADLERQLSHNVGGDPNAPIDQKLALQAEVLKYRDQIVNNTTATPAIATDAFSGALSARGDATIAQTAAAVQAAINVAPSDEDIEFLSAGALDLVRGGADAKTGANFLAAAGSQLRLTKTAKVAKNAARAVNLSRPFGNDERQAVGTFGFLTGEGNDSEGESAGTALLQLAGQVREASPGSTDTVSGLSDIANDPAKRSEFLKKLRGEERFKPIFERLVKDEDYRKQLEGVISRVPSFEQSDQLASDQAALLQALPTSAARDVKRGIVGTTESILSNDPAAISAIIREHLPDLEEAFGSGATASRIAGIIREAKSHAGENPAAALGTAQAQLGVAADQLRSGKVIRPAVRGSLEQVIVPEVRQPATAREIDMASRLDALIEVLADAEKRVNVQVKVNNRPATSDVRLAPPSGSRAFSQLSASPAGGR